jgi:hypothetical protein
VRSRQPRRPIIVWVPVGTHVGLVVLAALMDNRVAVGLTAIGAVVSTGAVIMHLRESDLDKDRIAHLQTAIPHLTAPLDADAAVNLAPKPSSVVTEVLRQQRPAALLGDAVPSGNALLGTASPISIPAVTPIDPG